ncbi:carbohydrate sulfotransferase 1-like [Diadema setosum]|uniref:carbohydrate sulfotransferase 1-like n=1 Tax=Diadema setosum TaxID=31175 RepID=UPI003B3A6A4C
MNRLTAFGVVCVAAIIFTLVAYEKLIRGSISPILPWPQDGDKLQKYLKAASLDRGMNMISQILNSSDMQKSNTVVGLPTSVNLTGRDDAEIVEDTSSSDLSSSVDETGEAILPVAGSMANRSAEMFLNEDVGDKTVVSGSRDSGKSVKEPLPLRENDNRPVQIVVLARMRTGSSLVGEIFNQNPTLFYIFEPLHAAQVLLRSHKADQQQRDNFYSTLLRMINACQFPSYFMTSLAKWGLGKSKSSGISPICKVTNGCSKASHEQLEERCKSFGNRVGMKTIRADLSLLESLVKDDHSNIKIIHLVRDPRGTANSRKSYYSDSLKKSRAKNEPFDLRGRTPILSLRTLGLLSTNPERRVNTIVSYCRWIVDAVMLARTRPAWLEGRYMMVRYEDLALDPIQVSEEIYDFVGMTMPKNVQEWVVNNTMGDNKKSKSTFSTHKNSTEAMQSWRHLLSYQEVTDVQMICGKAMSLLGYRPIRRPDDLVDMNFNVVEPLPAM